MLWLDRCCWRFRMSRWQDTWARTGFLIRIFNTKLTDMAPCRFIWKAYTTSLEKQSSTEGFEWMETKHLTFLGRPTRAVIKGGNTRILTPLYDPWGCNWRSCFQPPRIMATDITVEICWASRELCFWHCDWPRNAQGSRKPNDARKAKDNQIVMQVHNCGIFFHTQRFWNALVSTFLPSILLLAS